MPLFQNLLNFTYLVKKPSDGIWGNSNSSGRYRGMIGALHQKEIDIGMLPLQYVYQNFIKLNLIYSSWFCNHIT